MLHEVPDPVARVLLIGPFASQRHFSYIPWVRWARFLAARRVECLRYDYRGVGESTGTFEDLGFDDWTRDAEFLAAWLKKRSPETPIILHGLELGALLAAKVFERGLGGALLMWAAPASANEVLRAALMRQTAADNAFIAADNALKGVGETKSAPDYLRQLEFEGSVEVEGYRWSHRLWNESFKLQSPLGTEHGDAAKWAFGRPVRSVALDLRAAPLVKGSSMAYVFLNPDLTSLFTDSFDWMARLPHLYQNREQRF